MTDSKNLRHLMQRTSMLVVPGAYDAIGARLIEQAGYSAVYMTGAGASLSRGYPDLGLLTMNEMADCAAAMTRGISIPLIADADTGYGNELNMTRCVREYESRGVSAIQIEDQVMPKRCGHIDGKEIIPRLEFISKIRAAVSARSNTDFLIIARTDARAVVDLDEAINRANAALKAGADIAFVEAPQTLAEVATVPKKVQGPCLLNIVPGGRTPISSLHEAELMGYKIAILPALMLKATIAAGDAALKDLRETWQSPSTTESIAQTFKRFGSDEWDSLRSRFLDEPTAQTT